MTEHDIQKQIIQYLRLKGYLTIGTDVMAGLGFLGGNTGKRIGFINHHKALGYTKGQVDFVAIKDGKVLFVECKDKKGKRTKEQEHFAETLINQGLDYYLVRDVSRLVDEVTERIQQNLKDEQKEIILPENMKEGN